jgi:tripartite-type tricarboxylate transporter receptor subunit TctC
MKNNNKISSLIAAALICSFAMISSGAMAQAYPTKPVTIMVSYVPGGPADLLARVLAQSLQKQLGHPFIVENRPGASGTIGHRLNAKAAPDGYSLLFVADPAQTIVPHQLDVTEFDPLKDYTPIGLMADSPSGIFSSVSYKPTTLAELMADAKARPGQVKYADPGSNYAVLFAKQVGAEMVHVPFNGGAAAMTAVTGGHVDFIVISVPSAIDQVAAGTLRMLAVADTVRHPSAPNVPTTAEAGLPGFRSGSWFALEGPPGLPDSIVKTLNTAMREATKDPEFLKAAQRIARIAVSTPEEMKQRIDDDYKKWAVIKETKPAAPK